MATNKKVQLLIKAIISHVFVDFFTTENTAANDKAKNK
jgi:hypothetical protein